MSTHTKSAERPVSEGTPAQNPSARPVDGLKPSVLDYAEDVRPTERPSGTRCAAIPSMAPSSPDDSELMRRAKRGDRKAFGLLVRAHHKRIYRVALHMLRDAVEAEDVAQDTFVRAYAALRRFDGRSQPYTWFYRIAVNLSLNRLRSRKRRRHVAPEDDPRLENILLDTHPSAAPERWSTNRQMATALCAAVDDLSETLRTTLILVVIDGLSHGDAANVLGCPEGTVAWRVHEARKKIRSYLDARGLCDEERTHD